MNKTQQMVFMLIGHAYCITCLRTMKLNGKRAETISSIIRETMDTLQLILADKSCLDVIAKITEEVIRAYQKDNKVLICGNGGSAADAQHMAAELSGKFFFDRQPLFAEALHVNSSYLTAVANDYSFEEVFSRLVKAKGRPGDVLISLSTSGQSANIIKALETANRNGMITVGFTGEKPNALEKLCDYFLAIPSNITPRIQECHMVLSHIICEMVENYLFSIQRPAVFLDRDGVINKKMAEGDYVKKWSEFFFLPNVFEAIKLLNNHNYLVIVVTNQQCVGKRIVTMGTILSIHEKMEKAFRKNDARVDAVYVCPHTEDERCSCRKPGIGLLNRAVEVFRRKGISIDMAKSYLIGDSAKDILAGKNAGLGTLRVESNYNPGNNCSGIGILEAVQFIVNNDKRTRTAM